MNALKRIKINIIFLIMNFLTFTSSTRSERASFSATKRNFTLSYKPSI